MSHLFLRKNFIDPFEIEVTQHIEIVELECIWYYSKRTASAPYEARYSVHEFNILGENTLERSNLTIWEYFELLKKKPVEIQKRFQYNVTNNLFAMGRKYEDIALALGIINDYNKNKESYNSIFYRNTASPY